MAAPTIPPIRLGPIGTGLAIGHHTSSCPEIPVPPERNDMRSYGTEGVIAGSEPERRVTRGRSDAPIRTPTICPAVIVQPSLAQSPPTQPRHL